MPKMTRTSAAVLAGASGLWLFGMAAELATHRRQNLVGELPELTRLESLVERRRDDARRNALVHCREHCPPTFARVGHSPGEVIEFGRTGERIGDQVDQPRADHRSSPPDLRHLTDFDVV